MLKEELAELVELLNDPECDSPDEIAAEKPKTEQLSPSSTQRSAAHAGRYRSYTTPQDPGVRRTGVTSPHHRLGALRAQLHGVYGVSRRASSPSIDGPLWARSGLRRRTSALMP
jgi:hypothetical protein